MGRCREQHRCNAQSAYIKFRRCGHAGRYRFFSYLTSGFPLLARLVRVFQRTLIRTLALSLAALLLFAMLGSLPAIVRVIRMRRLERLLGWAYWRCCTRWTIESVTRSQHKIAELVPLYPNATEPHTRRRGSIRPRYSPHSVLGLAAPVAIERRKKKA